MLNILHSVKLCHAYGSLGEIAMAGESYDEAMYVAASGDSAAVWAHGRISLSRNLKGVSYPIRPHLP